MITSNFLAGAAGVLLSLALSFVPGLAQWLARKDPTWKRLTVLIAVMLVAAIAFGLSCLRVAGLPFQIECSTTGAFGLAESVFWCLVGNQAADRITPNVGAGKTPDPAGDLHDLTALDQPIAQ